MVKSTLVNRYGLFLFILMALTKVLASSHALAEEVPDNQGAADETAASQVSEDQPQAQPPTPGEWVELLRRQPPAPFISRVIVCEAPLTNKSVNVLAPQKLTAALTYLQFASAEDTSWSDKINRRHAWGKGSFKTRLATMLAAEGAQGFLTMPPVGRVGKLGLAVLDPNLNYRQLGEFPVTNGSARGVASALRQLLGYDAVVLAQIGDYVLAASPDMSGVHGLFNAVSLADSASRSMVSSSQRQADTILQFVAALPALPEWPQLSVWAVTLAKSAEPLLPGTKLILERLP